MSIMTSRGVFRLAASHSVVTMGSMSCAETGERRSSTREKRRNTGKENLFILIPPFAKGLDGFPKRNWVFLFCFFCERV
jgi:hypothetical protein